MQDEEKQRDEDKDNSLRDLDDELADLLGDESSEAGDNKKEPENDLESFDNELSELLGEDESNKKVIDDEFDRLIKDANQLVYSFDDDSINHAIDLFEQALSLKEGEAIHWYNLGQAYLKRAQKKVGIFSYAFEGDYKDPTDFYSALETSRKAVRLDAEDKVYWENLATIYEIMNKKPLALYCLIKTLELVEAQEKRLQQSGLIGSDSLQADVIKHLKEKIESLSASSGDPIDPFDEQSVNQYEERRRAEKIAKGLPLDHFELYMEALSSQAVGDNERSKVLLKKATEIKQDFIEAWLLLGNINTQEAMMVEDAEQQGFGLSEALRCINEALKIDPSSPEPYKILAKHHEFSGARDDYIRTIHKITTLEPGNWEYKKILADVYFEKGLNFHVYGDTIQAHAFFKKSIGMYPYDANTWKWYGKNFLLRQQYPEAIAAFKESLRLVSGESSTIQGLIEALQLQANNFYDQDDVERALENIDEILSFDPNNAKAIFMQNTIIEELTEKGYNALHDHDLVSSFQMFEKVLGIQEDYPFALFGLGLVYLARDDIEKGLDNITCAMEIYANDIPRYADEFVLADSMSMLKKLMACPQVPLEVMVSISNFFKELYKGFANTTLFIHNGRVRFPTVYKDVFTLLLDAGRITSDPGRDESRDVALSLLQPFMATSIQEHISPSFYWGKSEDTSGKDRLEIARDLADFLDVLFDSFLFRSPEKDVETIMTFINYLNHVFYFNIEEIYEILSFIKNGEHITNIFDLLATAMQVARMPLEINEFSTQKTPKRVVDMIRHPNLDIFAIISKDTKLAFLDNDFTQLNSLVYQGRISRFKTSDFQWSPSGLKAILSENKGERGVFKALLNRGNHILHVDFSKDPMITGIVPETPIEPGMIDAQVQVISVDHDAITISWKDDNTFQALLSNGSIVEWTVADVGFDRTQSSVIMNEGDLIAPSPDRRHVAMVSGDGSLVRMVLLQTGEVIEKNVSFPAIPETLKWDPGSRAIHFIGRKQDTGDIVIGRVTVEMDVKIIEFDRMALVTPLFFEPLFLGDHSFYLFQSGTDLVFTESSRSIWVEFEPDKSVESYLSGLLNVYWNSPISLKMCPDKPEINSIDLTKKIKQVITERVEFLKQFPRSTFIERIITLNSINKLLDS